ncbi:hypothetical protein [Tessaracoccus sp.]
MTVTNALTAYLPVVLYLSVVTILALGLGRIPFWAHPALIIPGLAYRFLTDTQWSDVAVAAAAGALMLAGGVFFLTRVVSGATLFTVVGAFTLAPLWWGYPGVLAGLVTAGLLTAWATARRLGGSHVQEVALQTVLAFGVSPAGFSAPDPEAIPGKTPASEEVASVRPSAGLLSIQPFLLGGVLVVAVAQVLLG